MQHAFGKAVATAPGKLINARLRCDVVVRVDALGKTLVEIMDPRAVLQLVGRPEIAEIAGEVRARLERVLAAV